MKARLNAGHFVSRFPDLPSRDPRLAKQLAQSFCMISNVALGSTCADKGCELVLLQCLTMYALRNEFTRIRVVDTGLMRHNKLPKGYKKLGLSTYLPEKASFTYP